MIAKCKENFLFFKKKNAFHHDDADQKNCSRDVEGAVPYRYFNTSTRRTRGEHSLFDRRGDHWSSVLKNIESVWAGKK